MSGPVAFGSSSLAPLFYPGVARSLAAEVGYHVRAAVRREAAAVEYADSIDVSEAAWWKRHADLSWIKAVATLASEAP